MMKNEEIVDGLSGLGFMSGYAITDGTITLWENPEPQPSEAEITKGAILWKEKELQLLEEKAAAKAALLAKLGITADEAKLLLS